MKRILPVFWIFNGFFLSCQHIETGDTLDKKTVGFIKKIGLLKEDERIIKFYSNFEKDKAGNFFTNKRVAHYWFDKHDSSKNEISFAFYRDIVAIDTITDIQEFDIPYVKITRRDSSVFKVFVDGKPEEKTAFFKDAIDIWKVNNMR